MKYIYIILIILPCVFFAHQANAALLYMSGAELNKTVAIADAVEVSSIVGSGVSTTTSAVARSGIYSFNASTTNNTAGWRVNMFGSDQNATGTIGVAVKIITRPNSKPQILRIDSSAGALRAGILLNASGTLSLIDSSANVVGGESSVIATSSINSTLATDWHCIELQAGASVASGTISARLDGTTFASGNNASQGSFGRFFWGANTPTSSLRLYFDDLYINDSSGSNQTDFMGCDRKMVLVHPDSAGDSNDWLRTGGAASSTDNYQDEDETPPDDITSYTQSNTSNRRNLYNVETPVGISNEDSISAVQVGGRFARTTATNTTFRYLLEKTSGGTITESASIQPQSTNFSTNAPTLIIYPITAYNDPDGNPWTLDTLKTMQIGERIVTGSTGIVQNTNVWAYIAYIDNYPPPMLLIKPSGITLIKGLGKTTVKSIL